MFAAERRQAILELVRSSGTVSLKDLARSVGCSEVTVRRDLQVLEAEGLLDRRRGGAAMIGALSHEPTYSEKSRLASREKVAIATLAVTLIDHGDAVALGAGTTTQELARQLTHVHDLTVVTNSVLAAAALAGAPHAEVIMTGGLLRGSTFALVGSAAERSLAELRVRRTFISGNGLSAERGLSTPNLAAAGVDRALARAAQEVVVLADRTKIGVDTMVQTVATGRIAHLVTDSGADPDVLDQLRTIGVTVHVATPDSTSASRSAGGAALDAPRSREGDDGLVDR